MGRIGGFSMVEALVTLVIFGVLAEQAYAGLQHYVIRVRRNEGEAALMRLMQQQERYYSRYNSYIAFSSSSTDPEAMLFRWWTGSSARASAYEVEGKACEGELIAQCVRLIARPGTGMVDVNFHDDDCQELTLTSAGLRLASGPGAHCWP
jgi:type IV pilus assembly protein PilE